jgi:hypothetical protein
MDDSDVTETEMEPVPHPLPHSETNPPTSTVAFTETELNYKEKFYIAMACCNGLRSAMGRIPLTEDYTSQESFTELEIEYDYFREFLERQWKLTKKKIRKKHLWTKKRTDRLQESDVNPTER